MEKQRRGQLIIIGVLAFAILFMSIGFANYSKNLQINGEVTVKKASWDVRWDNTSFAKDNSSVNIDTTSSGMGFTQNDTNFSFKATLTQPGDYAKFTINAKNAGTFDAVLTAITMTDVSSYPYLSYVIKYGNQQFGASTSGINTTLAAGASEVVTVTVTYITPADSADLPHDNDVTVNLSGALAFSQAS